MSRRLVVGFDACDPDIAVALAHAGRMPVLAGLLERGGHAEVLLPDGVFVGVVWPVLTRGVSPAGTGRHSWIDVDPDTYTLRVPDKRTMGGTAVWDALARHGHRSVLFDVPHDHAEPNDRIIRVVEWGAHDHHVGFETWPPSLGNELVGRFGTHDLLGMYPAGGGMHYAPDDYLLREGALRTTEEDLALAALVTPGIERKASATSWLLQRHDWELAVVGFGESHAIGHQLWHVHDSTHPRHDPGGLVHGSPVENTYVALDAALGEVVAAAEADTVALLLTHGMGPHYDAVHLLEELLGRWDSWLASTDAAPPSLRRRLRAGMGRIPRGAHRLLGGPIAHVVRARGLRPGESVEDPEIDPATRRRRKFFRSWNNDVVGGIRLNVAGREAAGVVDPNDVDELLGWLEQQLRSVIDVRRGRPLVRDTYRCNDRYPEASDTTLPDLFIEWHRDAPIECVWSPTSGVVHHAYTLWRTGDHRQRSMVVAAGEGIVAGAHPAMHAGAVPAAVAALFDVELPDAQEPPTWWSAQSSSRTSS